MLERLREWVQRWLGIAPRTTITEAQENTAFVADYESADGLNLTAIIANRLSNIVVSDSTISVTGGNKTETLPDGRTVNAIDQNERSAYLDRAIQRVAAKLKLIVTRAFAIGGVVLKPAITNGELYTDILPQSRMTIIEQTGEVVTAAAFEADTFTRGNCTYTRMEYHKLDNSGNYTIEQKALQNGREIAITSVPEWAAHAPTTTIKGINKMLFAFIKCPTDSRKDLNSIYGVPITYGNRKLADEIVDMLDVFHREFINKETFIGADSLVFEKDETGREMLPKSGLFKLFRANAGMDDKPFFEVFSPDIRDESMINSINFKLGLLEKAVGVNHGVLTDLEVADATATAIKRSTLDTFNVVETMRDNIETALEQLVYAFNVYADLQNEYEKQNGAINGSIPAGEYAISYDWDYSLIEDSTERFNQLLQSQGAGVVSPAETRAWVMNLSLDEAERTLPNSDALIEGD